VGKELVGEFEARFGFILSRVSGDDGSDGTSPLRLAPREVVLPFDAIAGVRSRYSVHDPRPAVSTASRSSGSRSPGA
jgi:hypothetical protein